MDTKVSVWKANLNSGIIIGLLGVVVSLLFYFLDLTLENWVAAIWFPIYIVALFLAIRSYRVNFLKGFMTYGQSLGAGVIIVLYYAIISSVFAFILYSYIDPGLLEKMMAAAEQRLTDRGMAEGMIEQSLQFQEKIMVPWVMAISSLVNSMIMGTIIVLVLSIFTRKEGNPLIDDSIEE